MTNLQKTLLVEFLSSERKKCSAESVKLRTSQQNVLMSKTKENKHLVEHYGELAVKNETKARTYQEILDFIEINLELSK